MSETLIGVLIGGLLSSLGTWITIAVQHRRWAIETKIARLNAKRERLEVAYERTLDSVRNGVNTDFYSSNMMSEIEILFPDAVSKAFNELMDEKDRSEFKIKMHYYNIALAMKKSLKSIEDKIDAQVL